MSRPVIREAEVFKKDNLAVLRVLIDVIADNPKLTVPQAVDMLGILFGPEGEQPKDTLKRVENNARYYDLLGPRRDADR